MLKTGAAFIVVTLVSVYGLQQYVEKRRNDFGNDVSQNETQQQPQAQQKRQVAAVQPAKPKPLYGRKARLQMDNKGHFVAQAKMNDRPVEVLVDTGATTVAINEKTARRLGIMLKPSDFIHNVSTANGTTKAAAVMIDKIQIGNVIVRNVQAAVLDDRSLTSTLLGMSFLGQLNSFQVKNRELVLVQ